MATKFRKLLGCVLVLSVITGCRDGERKYKDVFKVEASQQDSVMLTYPLDQQIEIYLEGIRYQHPPTIYLGQTLAEHREKILPFVMANLEGADADWEKEYLLFVLGYMSCWKLDLSERQDVIAVAERAVSTMTDTLRALEGHRFVKMIRKEECPRDSPPFRIEDV